MWIKACALIIMLLLLTCPATAANDEMVVVPKSQVVQLLRDNALLRKKLEEAKGLLDRGATALGQCSKKIEALEARAKRDSCA